ncbi:MAG TPA: diphosphomevalonate decarboxylase, partial [Polyangiaceae bacterium]|nr:diphosphomevalonate decarboxylase [Polyangiaceae bacterium]
MTIDTKKRIGRAEACANIALAKYWGKSDRGDNLTAVPSLSLSLDALRTRTEVVFDEQRERDVVTMGGEELSGRPLERVSAHLDRIRERAGFKLRARVTSENNFPTAAGLASSASGFAALATAAARAAGLELSRAELSSLARKSSASAGRSLFEGFAILDAETDQSQALAPREHWDVAMVVAVITAGPKPIGSTGGMEHTKRTCPYYPAWENVARSVFEQVKQGVERRDFTQVAEAMEHSTRLMHATMLSSL